MAKTNYYQKYTDKQTEVKFLLGGIGTGNISVGVRGNLCEFELFNNPSKDIDMPYTFFATHIKYQNGNVSNRLLESELPNPHRRPVGYASLELAGLPRFESSVMEVAYPFSKVTLKDKEIPLKFSMESYTPFIPLSPDDSGIPGAYITYDVYNPLDEEVEVSICGSFANPVGFEGYDLFHNMLQKADVVNEYFDNNTHRGIHFYSKDLNKKDRMYGDFVLATPDKEISQKATWLCGAWWDGIHDFWNQFSVNGEFDERETKTGQASAFNSLSRLRVGSLAIKKTIKPKSHAKFKFMISWCFPNRPNRWEGHLVPHNSKKRKKIVRNYYSYRHPDAMAAMKYLIRNEKRLYNESLMFTKALYNSTLPIELIDAVSANITTIRSTTCYRINKEGTFLAWEGCFTNRGSCEGNCTHVWNYAQTLAFLFPTLEQNMRKTEFLHETDEEGNMSFRTNSIFDDPRWDMLPATDGQLGCVIRLYRDWRLSGDNELISSMWDAVKRVMKFAADFWDSDKDGVLDSRQHNTYDIEFYGPNSLSNSIYFTALNAAIEMAEFMNDSIADSYKDTLERGKKIMDEYLWNGEYYIQNIEDVNEYKYQYGIGCLSDQVFGELLANVVGLPNSLPKDHISKAVKSIYKYNFRSRLKEHENVQRVYGLNDEAGLLLCSWPYGKRPLFPFVYADEVWSGIEYQVAAHLIFENEVEAGLNIIKAVRNRYNGYNRNPFCEIECGNHYARSLASYSAWVAYTGYRFDLRNNEISFSPKGDLNDFHAFFVCGKGWGIYHNVDGHESIETLYGDLSGIVLKTNPKRLD